MDGTPRSDNSPLRGLSLNAFLYCCLYDPVIPLYNRSHCRPDSSHYSGRSCLHSGSSHHSGRSCLHSGSSYHSGRSCLRSGSSYHSGRSCLRSGSSYYSGRSCLRSGSVTILAVAASVLIPAARTSTIWVLIVAAISINRLWNPESVQTSAKRISQHCI